MIDEVGLTEQEREVLAAAQEMYTLKLHNGWRRIRKVMSDYEKQALISMEQCVSSDERLRSHLQIRWQERVSLNKFLDVYLENILEQRKAILREIAEAKGNTQEEAFAMAEQL